MFERFASFVKESGEEVYIKQFFSIANNFNYVLIGGWAVGLYVASRIVTVKDLDILFDSSDYNSFADDIELLDFSVGGAGGVGILSSKVKKGTFSFDVLITDNHWEFDALDYYRQFVWDRIPLKVAYPEFLIIMKLYSGRDKDLTDVQLLLKSGFVNIKFFESLLDRYFSRDVYEDIKSLLELSTIL